MLAGLSAVAALSCSIFFETPRIQVVEVSLESIGFTGGVVQVTLDVQNPNGFDLRGRGFDYRLDFQDGDASTWRTLAEGTHDEDVTIPGEESGTIEVDVPFAHEDLGAAVTRLLRQGLVEYRFTGDIRFDTPIGMRSVGFDERGRFRP